MIDRDAMVWRLTVHYGAVNGAALMDALQHDGLVADEAVTLADPTRIWSALGMR